MTPLAPCHKCGQPPQRIRIMCDCGTFIEHHGTSVQRAVEAWNRRAEMKGADKPERITHAIGATVLLRPYDDLKAIVRGVYLGQDEVKYECAWFRNDGSRCIEFFFPTELEKLQ